MLEQVIFYAFAAILMFAAVRVVASRNPVHSALFLVLAFVATTPLWIIAGSPFLGLVLVFVYVGAVMTLFIFVVMMLNLQKVPSNKSFVKFLPLALIVIGVMVGLMMYVVSPEHFTALSTQTLVPLSKHYSNTKALGMSLFGRFLLPFEMAGALLLVGIVSAISLAFRGPRARKVQHPGEQSKVKAEDRLRIVKMPAEKK
jgi:NADH-quinone oxidoreductase subunit J